MKKKSHVTNNKNLKNQQNKKLLEIDELKSNFVSMISHELRTPLAVIKEGISIVIDGTAGKINSKQNDFLNTAKRNVDRLNCLINNVLDFQKLEAKKMAFKIEKRDINKLIIEIVKQFESLVRKKRLKLILSLGKDIPSIPYDSDRITQVLTNLISNAVKFTEKGNITITSEKKFENTVCISVSDTGVGIKKEDMNKLFKSFSQIISGKDRKTRGTGLGLAISKKIIDEHRGKISAQSEHNRGSTFSFILPIWKRRSQYAENHFNCR